MNRPFVSVIIVNYNGAHFLPACLEALAGQTYPRKDLEVIVSDNGSTDGSLALVQNRYPWVRLLANGKNLGFATGNNRAIRMAQGQHFVLLNNDTAPSPDWLEHLVSVAESDSDCGLVTGKIYLYYDQLLLRLDSDTIQPLPDPRTLGVQVFSTEKDKPGEVVQYQEGFYGWEEHPDGSRFRWCQGQSRLGLPIPPGEGDWSIHLQVAAPRPDDAVVSLQIRAADLFLGEWKIAGPDPVHLALTVPAKCRTLGQPLVQNAGSIIFENGSGRDRGTYVRNDEVFYEIDQGQYERVEEVFAGCGANLLIKRTLLKDVGCLDDDFFMYYEDTDLAWRARLRGWKVLYAPQAVIRHIHCGSSVEWSPLFIFHVERNRLAMIIKNGPWLQVFKTWGHYLGTLLVRTLRGLPSAIRSRQGYSSFRAELSIPYRILADLGRQLPTLIRKRISIQHNRRVSFRTLSVWFHKQEP